MANDIGTTEWDKATGVLKEEKNVNLLMERIELQLMRL